MTPYRLSSTSFAGGCFPSLTRRNVSVTPSGSRSAYVASWSANFVSQGTSLTLCLLRTLFATKMGAPVLSARAMAWLGRQPISLQSISLSMPSLCMVILACMAILASKISLLRSVTTTLTTSMPNSSSTRAIKLSTLDPNDGPFVTLRASSILLSSWATLYPSRRLSNMTRSCFSSALLCSTNAASP